MCYALVNLNRAKLAEGGKSKGWGVNADVGMGWGVGRGQ